MKTMFLKSVLSCIFSLLLTGCGLSIYEDWKASGGKAITGGGAIAGKDYINGLVPSADSRKYFSKLAISSDQPIETVSRTDDNTSKSGVRFVKNGGIVIPPGVTISFTNKGYCMDPHLPAPKAGEEFQLVPVTQLIPEDLQGTYKKLVQKASAGDESVKRNMQHLVWALRTAGTDAAYANNLTSEQKRILNRCSEYSGQFEEFNATAKANSQMLKELLAVADSYLNVKIGGVTYKASDLLDPDIGNKKINEHLNQLINMGKSLPVERSGFNYGELQKGIYTDVRGSGVLQYTAKIANSTNKEFIFYPTDYAGQVGSGTKSQGLTFFATANTSQRQRVTGGNPDKIEVEDQIEPEKKCPPHDWHATVNGANEIKLDLSAKNNIQSNLSKIRNLTKNISNDLRNKTKITGKEFGTIIYILDGEVKMTNVTVGGPFTNNLGQEGEGWHYGNAQKQLPKGAQPLAMVHSHPSSEGGFWAEPNASDVFSFGDMGIGFANGINVYLVSPVNDNIWEFNPYTSQITCISGPGHNNNTFLDKTGDQLQKEETDTFNKIYKIFCKKCGAIVTL